MNRQLILWQVRQTRLINVFAVAAAVVYIAAVEEPMRIPGTLGLLLVVMLHSAMIVFRLGKTSRENGFVYVQGFTRDQIWWATWATTLLSGMLVSAASGVVIWSGLRHFIQDTVMESPWFVVPVHSENVIPLLIVFHYVVMLPLMHYAWVRAGQPYRDTAAGWMLMCLGLFLYIWGHAIIYGHRHHVSFLAVVAACHLPAIVAVTLAAWKTHRTLEVRS